MVTTVKLDKSFDSGYLIPKKARFCTEWEENSICVKCDGTTNQTKEFQPTLNELERQLVKIYEICQGVILDFWMEVYKDYLTLEYLK